MFNNELPTKKYKHMKIIKERKIQPKINIINSDFIKTYLTNPFKHTLDNGIPVYIINKGTQDLVKIELIFTNGLLYKTNNLVAKSTSDMLKLGTVNYTSNEIADIIDYCGAYIETTAEKDMTLVSLYTLNKHLEKTLPVLEEIIKRPVFPKNELSIYLQKQKQEFIVNNKKVDFIAKRKFNELLFGANNHYGKTIKLNDFDKIKPEQLFDFHKKYYSSNNCKIIAAGKVTEDIIDNLNRYFGQNDWYFDKKNNNNKSFKISSNRQFKHFIPKDNVVQSAIRIGKILFNKTNPDFMGLDILNTVLGGYFGSRLMTNIREDKGYTYGIGSALISLQKSGYFCITSQVRSDVSSKAVKEIYKELKRLKQEIIPDKELNLVRNYILGNFLRSIDGPFAIADKFIDVLNYQLDYNYYFKYFDVIKNISAEKLKQLAEKYLDNDNMFELIVGKKQ